MVDVITIGETMIRLCTNNYQTLEQAQYLNFSIGGSESNVAICLSRLGMKVMWISKLTDNSLGRKIFQEIHKHGVDTSNVIWTEEKRVGVYFIEYAAAPRPIKVIYDRKNSAMSTFKPEEVNWECFQNTRLIHLTGITGSLSKNCEELVKRATIEGKKRRKIVSFDLNYRAKLWNIKKAKKHFEDVLPYVDILIATKKDIELVFGIKGKPEDMMEKLREKFNTRIIVLTAGSDGSFAFDGKMYYAKVYPATEIDRIGAGDAFTAGFLYGYLTKNIESGILYGNAMASLKHTIPGDIAYINPQDMIELINKQQERIQR